MKFKDIMNLTESTKYSHYAHVLTHKDENEDETHKVLGFGSTKKISAMRAHKYQNFSHYTKEENFKKAGGIERAAEAAKKDMEATKVVKIDKDTYYSLNNFGSPHPSSGKKLVITGDKMKIQ